MANSKYPQYIDEFSRQIDDDIKKEDLNLAQSAVKAVQKELGRNPSGDKENVRERLDILEREKLDKNIPFNLNTRLITDSDGTDKVEISWSYAENDDIDHFVLEVWDEETETYKPYDGQHGIVEK